MSITPVQPILTAHLFPGLHRELMSLLRSLEPDHWRHLATSKWTVKDVAAHLLDGDVRQISFRRDGLPPVPPPFPIETYADLVRFLNGLNHTWVDACQRMSPALLVELHALTGPIVAEIFQKLDPSGPALFGVAWAGETESQNWFDTAREYTERWHHQQQIRDAVGAPGLTDREWLHPVIDTFMRALPHAYRHCDAPDGTVVAFHVTGEAGGDWAMQRDRGAWRLYRGETPDASCRLQTDPDTTWRTMTKGLKPREAARRIRVDGEEELAAPFRGALAIMG
jgi:hypothetical protein